MATPPGTRQETRRQPVTWLFMGTEEGIGRVPGHASTTPDVHPERLHAGVTVSRLCEGPGEEMLAGTLEGSGLLKSVDGGVTWRRIESLRDVDVCFLGTFGGPVPVTYAGTEPAHLYRSEDAGNTWEEVEGFRRIAAESAWQSTDGGPRVTAVHPDATDPAGLFVAVESGGVFWSGDQGDTWEARNEGLSNEVHALAAHPEEPEALWAATSYGVHRSEDEGRSWRARNSGLAGTYVTALAVHPSRDADSAYCAAANGPGGQTICLYETTDAGNSWRPFEASGLPQNLHGIEAGAFVVDPADPESLLAGTLGGDIWITRNRGRDWQLLAGNMPPVHALLVEAERSEMY